MFSQFLFLPTVILTGIMFPADLLPKVFGIIGKLLPGTWGLRMMTADALTFADSWPLLLMFVAVLLLCVLRLRRHNKA